MYIVRWLTGHPIIAVWVLAIIAILLSYGSTGNKGDDSEKKSAASGVSSIVTGESASSSVIEHQKGLEGDKIDKGNTLTNSEAVKEIKTDAKEESSSIAESISSSDNVAEISVDSTKQNTASTSSPDRDGANMPKSESDITNNSLTLDNLDSNKNETDKKVLKKTEEADSNNVTASTDINSAAVSQDHNSDIADLGEISSDEMLKMAREAYWNNGLEEAAQIYQQLIKNEPQTVGHRGELGNVYWRQGYPKKAAEIYSEIAIPMIENGNSDRVANMIGFIGLFYPDRASVIHDRLQKQQ